MSDIEWESCLLAQRPAPELDLRFERETGRPGKSMRNFEGYEWLGDTVISMSVQLATSAHIDARMQCLARNFEVDIVLTDTLKQNIDPRFETHELHDTLVKGVAKPLAIHALH
jgi:hypothetical protein